MKTLSIFQKKVIHPILKSCLIAVIGVCGTAAPSEALPAGVPSRHCSEISNPRPGTLCYVLHDNLGGKATAGGSPQGGELIIEPQAGYYVVDSTAIEVTSAAGNGTHSKRVLAVGANVESVNGYESRLTEVDRVINELEGRITGVAGPAVYEARNKLTYLRERRAEYSEYYRTAVSTSRNAPTTQYTWSASSRSCGTLNLDTCGSWISFRVYEVRRYLGDPIAEYNALLVPAIEQARSAVRNAESNPQPQPQPSSSACVSVDSRSGWQHFNLPGSFTSLTSISGGWSVDTNSYAPVGATGHSGRDAEALAPYNQYKFDQRFPFGALLMGSQGVLWIQSPVSFSAPFNAVDMRINDADNALGDNGGSLQVCFGN